MKTAALRSVCILPALAVAAITLPAQAQVVSAGYQGVSKSEAILGGAPSALAAITARQDGQAYLQPAVANYVRPAVTTDRPDVFNSVALSIGRSPLDARWSQVSGAGVGGNAGAFAASLRNQDVLSKLEAVNGYVNAVPRFTEHAQVINGFSDVILELYGYEKLAARTSVGVPHLPFGMPVEVDAILAIST